MTDLNELTGKVIGAAIEAHKGITLPPPEGLWPFARLAPARHQLRFRRWQAGLCLRGKQKHGYYLEISPSQYITLSHK